MPVRARIIAACLAAVCSLAPADETLYRYEGNVMPADPSAGWLVFNPCEPPCSESVEAGHFVVRWPDRLGGDFFEYGLRIAEPPVEPPPSLWVEWRFRANCPLGQFVFTDHAVFTVRFGAISDALNLYGDATISFSGDDSIHGLALDTYHTYRFESLDGETYAFSVNGETFVVDSTIGSPNPAPTLLLKGRGECETDPVPDVHNMWDFVWYGTITAGEAIVSADPPAGYLDPAVYGTLDRFTVTFDQAAYVYIDDVTVQVTGGTAPAVMATQRKENTEPDTVEIVLDRPLPMNEATTFTFDTGGGARQENVVEYRLGVGPVPATSALALAAMIAAILAAGILLARRGVGQE